MNVSGLPKTCALWVSRLVRIPSVSPSQSGPKAGRAGEAEISRQAALWFRKLGGKVETDSALPGRANVYGTWKGDSGRWIALDIHLDTVGVEQMAGNPFSGEISNGRVHGRGSVDTKASLGVVLALLDLIKKGKLKIHSNLLVACTVDEEHGMAGAYAFARWLVKRRMKIDKLLVAEPTSCVPVIGHKGVSRILFSVQGKSAHSSRPELGKNAITAAARLVTALDFEDRRLRSKSKSSPLGAPTLSVTMTQGGTGINVIPDSCSVYVDRRTVENEKPVNVFKSLSDLARKSCPLPLFSESLLQNDSFYQDPGSPWIGELSRWSGEKPRTAPYGTNAGAYKGLYRESVIMGPGSIDQAHGREEWVTISQLSKFAQLLSRWWQI